MGPDAHMLKNKQDKVSDPDVDWVHDNLKKGFDLNMNNNPSTPNITEDEERYCQM